MPVYEYICQDCQKKFERLQSFGQNGPVNCPTCNGDRVRKAISAFASFSKGEGGVTRSVGGSACGSCAPSSSCSTCR